jgi:hypothetical protein
MTLRVGKMTRNIAARLVVFFKKELAWNATVLSLMLLSMLLFIAAIVIKISGNNMDVTVDFMKLLLVWINLAVMCVLLEQKKVLSYGALWLRGLFVLGLIACNLGAVLNLSILILSYSKPNAEDDQNFLPFNYDFLTLGVTLVTDVLYLIFYILFRSSRAIITSVTLILAEIIIFAVCAHVGTDAALDFSNLSLSLITGLMALLLWSAKVVLNSAGAPLEFKDYFERDDLSSDELEPMVSHI